MWRSGQLSRVAALLGPHRLDDCPECPRNLLLVDGAAAVINVDGIVALWSLFGVLRDAWRFCSCNVYVGRSGRPAEPSPRFSCSPQWRSSFRGHCVGGCGRHGDGEGDPVGSVGTVAPSRSRWRSWSVCSAPGCNAPASPISSSSLRLAASPAQVRDAIARTLRDDSLELAFWLPDRDRYVGRRRQRAGPGRPARPGGHGRSSTTASASPRSSTTPRCSTTPPSSRRSARRRAWRWRTPACRPSCAPSSPRCAPRGPASSRPATPSADALERDLHDGAQQRLLGIRLALQLARGRLADGGAAVDELLAEAEAEVVGTLDELRALARGIHPAVLTDEGLDAALDALARRVPSPSSCTVCAERLPATVEATAYFVASEALANVVKHAHATRATIEISRANGRVAIEITDDGVGGADADGAGLRGLRDRVEALDGACVDSAPGQGTRVTAAIPCG